LCSIGLGDQLREEVAAAHALARLEADLADDASDLRRDVDAVHGLQ